MKKGMRKNIGALENRNLEFHNIIFWRNGMFCSNLYAKACLRVKAVSAS